MLSNPPTKDGKKCSRAMCTEKRNEIENEKGDCHKV